MDDVEFYLLLQKMLQIIYGLIYSGHLIGIYFLKFRNEMSCVRNVDSFARPSLSIVWEVWG